MLMPLGNTALGTSLGQAFYSAPLFCLFYGSGASSNLRPGDLNRLLCVMGESDTKCAPFKHDGFYNDLMSFF